MGLTIRDLLWAARESDKKARQERRAYERRIEEGKPQPLDGNIGRITSLENRANRFRNVALVVDPDYSPWQLRNNLHTDSVVYTPPEEEPVDESEPPPALKGSFTPDVIARLEAALADDG